MHRPFISALLLLALPVAAASADDRLNSDPIFPAQYQGDGVGLRDVREGDVLYPVQLNGLWGYANQFGDLVMLPTFAWTDDFYDGVARAVERTADGERGKTGFIKTSGEWYLPPRYPYADRFENGYAVVGDGSHLGIIDRKGELVVPVKLDGALRFREDFAAVQSGERVGFVNVRGDVVIPLRYRRARSFHEGLAAVELPGEAGAGGQKLGAWGYIGKRGELAWVDRTGQVTALGDFNDGLARVRVGDRWGYVDRRFQLVIQPVYEEARDFTNGVAAVKVTVGEGVKEGEQWGYVDKAGRWSIQPRFEAADDLDDVLAMVREGGRWGYVNRTGSTGYAARWADARPFFRGLARVSQVPGFGYIDPQGRARYDPRGPLVGIFDHTPQGDAKRKLDRDQVGTPVLVPVDRGDEGRRVEEAYPPEYLYEEVLPRE